MAKVSEIKNTGEIVTLVTHAGNFHSDDVVATAILRLYFLDKGIDTKTVRTFKPAEMGYTDATPNCVIYDVGLGQYDHHQIGDEAKHCIRIDTNEDGTTVERKYAAVGLLWKEIGEEIVGKYADVIYDSIIRPIDNHDNGFGNNPLSTLIGAMNSIDPNATKEDHDICFYKAVDVITVMLVSTFLKYKQQIKNEEELQKYAEANPRSSCLVYNCYLSGADEVCREMGIPFYVYPNIRGGWCFKTICPDPKNLRVHLVDIPDEVRTWTGVTFLHPSCFLGSAVTKERAIEICETLCHAPYSNYLD